MHLRVEFSVSPVPKGLIGTKRSTAVDVRVHARKVANKQDSLKTGYMKYIRQVKRNEKAKVRSRHEHFKY